MKSGLNLKVGCYAVVLFLGAATKLGATTYEWNGGTGDWTSSANWTPAGTPGAGDAAVIGGGTVTLNTDVSVTDLDLENATLSGTGTLTITGQFNWSGSSTLSGGGATVISSVAAAELSGSGDHSLVTRTLRIEGLFKHPGPGRLVVNSGSSVEITSSGTYEIEDDVGLIYFSGGAPTFTLSGSLIKSGGNGESVLQNIPLTLTSGASVNCDTGSLRFPHPIQGTGTFNAAEGTSITFQNNCNLTDADFTGPGLQVFSSGTLTLSGDCTATHIELAGATLNGTHTLAGNWTWTTGQLSGEGKTTIPQGSVLLLSGAEEHTITTRTLRIDGTFLHEGTGRLNLNSSAILEIGPTGLAEMKGDRWWHHFSGGQSTIINAGTILKSGGTGEAKFENQVFNNTGLLDLATGSMVLQNGSFNNTGEARVRTGTLKHAGGGTSTGLWTISAGATALFSSGSPVLAQGTRIEGAGLFKVDGASLDVSGVVEIPRLELHSGTLGGDGTVNVGSEFAWSGASTMSGNGATIIGEGVTATLSGDGNHTINTRTLTIGGTLNHEPTGRLDLNSGASVTITSKGSYDLQGDVILHHYSGATPSFTISGMLRKSAGTGESRLDYIPVNITETGEVHCQSGTLRFPFPVSGTGTFEANAPGSILFANHCTLTDANFTGTGRQTFSSGTLTLSGTFPANNNEIAGATLNGTHTLSGTWDWSSGNLSGDGITTIPDGSTFTLLGTTEHTISTRTLKVDGTFVHQDSGRLNLNASAVLETGPTGLIDIMGDYWWHYFSGGQSTIINAGTIIKSGGTGEAKFENQVINNTGLFDLASGSILLRSGSFNNTGETHIRTGTLEYTGGGTSSGNWTIDSGATALFSGGSPVLEEGASFEGDGLVKVDQGNLIVAGVVDIPRLEMTRGSIAGTGTLNLTGEFAWNGVSSMSGGGTTVIKEGAVATLSGGANRTLNSRSLVVEGTLNHEHYVELDINSGSSVEIAPGGLYDVQGDAVMKYYAGGAPVFTVNGTLRKSTGTGKLTFENIQPVNGAAGRIESLGGTIRMPGVTGGGTFLAGDGAQTLIENTSTLTDVTFEGDGINRLTGGTVTLNGNCSATSLEIDGANIAGSHTLHGTWHWKDGQFNGPGTTSIANDGILRLISDGDHVINNRILTDYGLIEHVGSGRLVLNSGSLLDVKRGGVVDIQTPCEWVHTAGGAPSIVNNGTILKSTDGTVSIRINSFTGNGKNIPESGWLLMNGNWLFHKDQGIIYLRVTSPSGFLLYDFRIQSWGWSSEDLYPYIYWYPPINAWTYYAAGYRPDHRWFYDLSHVGWLFEMDMIP